MRKINPDYAGVIMIEGTIYYPVVRGSDNVKYLNTTISGTENQFGAVFMDYRNAGNNEPHIIIYGHAAADIFRNGYMFSRLFLFLDEQHMADHPVIMLIENGQISEFEIFSARLTDVNDPAYQLDFSAPGDFGAFLERNGAPPDAAQILTLSTCYLEGGDDGRMIVQGSLRRVLSSDRVQMMIAEVE
jgi:sortase B